MKIANISGIKVSVHWTFFLLILWIVISSYMQSRDASVVGITLLFVLSLFVCVVLHELGHALTAKTFGIRTLNIILLPIGGIAQMKKMPEKPSQELLIAFAGPAVNVAIAGLLYIAVLLLGLAPAVDVQMNISSSNFIFLLFSANLILAVFNLIPAFPMDGGRVLRAILAFNMNRDKATRIAAYIGQFIAVAFIFLGLFYNPLLILIGLFVFLGAQMEAEFVHSGFLLRSYKMKDVLLTKYYSLGTEKTVDDAVKILLSVQAKDFLVIDQGNVKGTLSRNDIIKALSEKGGSTPLSEAMNKEFVSFKTQDSVDKVFSEMRNGKQHIFPVFDNGNLAGAVDSDNINEILLVDEAKEILRSHKTIPVVSEEKKKERQL